MSIKYRLALIIRFDQPLPLIFPQSIEQFATRVGYEVEAVSAEAIDPETGEILPPLA